MTTIPMTRAQLLSRGARGGAAVLVAGGSLAALAERARAEPLSDNDLAHARLLVGVELLAANFYGQALAAGTVRPKLRKYLRRALANEQEHYRSVAAILTGAGLAAATASDLDYTYPRATFAAQSSILKLALELESTMLGIYLGAVQDLQSSALKGQVARIAASEASHVTYLSIVKGRNAFMAFPPALTIEQGSNAIDRFIA